MSPVRVAVAGVGKPSNAANPNAIANELICGDLGRILRLPIPPGFIVYKEAEPYHVSLNFYLAGEDLPRADAASLVAEHPKLACGIVAFDIWVCNGDRHAKNIAFDQSTKRVNLFDHSHAFMHGAQGRKHLEGQAGSLGILPHHCLVPQIANGDHFGYWIDRIERIPEFYIRDSIRECMAIGMTSDDADFCTGFLLDRRTQLTTLLDANKASFPKLQPSLIVAVAGAAAVAAPPAPNQN
jgi:hypothetical protein